MVFWKRFRISIIYFILICIIIYINITIFEYFMTPFEFGFWTFELFEPLMLSFPVGGWLLALAKISMLVTAFIQIWIDALYRDSSKGLCNYAFMHLLFWIVSKLFKIHIIYNIIYILYYILIYYLRELNHFIRPNA